MVQNKSNDLQKMVLTESLAGFLLPCIFLSDLSESWNMCSDWPQSLYEKIFQNTNLQPNLCVKGGEKSLKPLRKNINHNNDYHNKITICIAPYIWLRVFYLMWFSKKKKKKSHVVSEQVLLLIPFYWWKYWVWSSMTSKRTQKTSGKAHKSTSLLLETACWAISIAMKWF